MRFFLTGATGFIGGVLARQLVAAGHHVVTVARDAGRAEPLAAIGVQVHRGDITDRGSLVEPMRGADGLFHLAAWYKIGPRDRGEAQRANVEGTRNVLEVMGELGIPRGVYTSSVVVFSNTSGTCPDERHRHEGPFLNEYERTKWIAHREVAEPMMRDGLPLVIVMPGIVYGPGDTSAVGGMLRDHLRRRLPAVPSGAGGSWAHVDDVARGHVLAFERGRVGESYILAGEFRTYVEVLALAERISGTPGPRLRPSPAVMRAAAAVVGLAERIFPVPADFSAEALRTVAGVTYCGSAAKARGELGFEPRPFEEGWHETVEHEMARLGIARPALP